MPINTSEKIILTIEFFLYAFQLSVLFVLLAKIHKELNSAFYRVLLIIFVSDFVYFVFVAIVVLRFPKYGIWREFYEANGWFGALGYTCSGFLGMIQFFGQTLLSFNRFTLLWMPLKHQKIWASKWYLIAIILIPFLIVGWRLPAEGYYRFYENGEVSVGYVSLSIEKLASSTVAAFFIFFATLSLILTILTVIKFAREKKLTPLVTPDKQINLLVFSIILLCVQLLRAIYVIIFAIFILSPSVTSFLHDILPLLIDAHAWFAAAAILILSPTTRKIYYKFYGLSPFIDKFNNRFNNRIVIASAVNETTNIQSVR